MTTLANLLVLLSLDDKEFNSAMDAAVTKTQSTAERISTKFQSIGSGMVSGGQKLTAGLTLPIVGAGVVAVNYASSLEETKNKTGVIFGEMSEDILAWFEERLVD